MAMMEIPSEHQQEYNRWYDLDHLPEHVSKPDVVMARRYVAPWRLRAAPGTRPDPLVGGHAPYLSTYLLGGPVDHRDEGAVAEWTGKDRRLIKAGRFWREGRVVHVSRWELTATYTRPTVRVGGAAVPYLAHRGVIVALGRPAAADAMGPALAWWDQTYLPDLLSTAGLVAAIRCGPLAAPADDLILHLLLCDDHPAEVMGNLERGRVYQRALGRYPPHGGVYEELTFLPYELVVPFDYSFELDEPGEAGGRTGDG
jgi:hypothetical protein